MARFQALERQTANYRYDVRWDLALSLKPLFIMVSNSACENKALYFRCFIQYHYYISFDIDDFLCFLHFGICLAIIILRDFSDLLSNATTDFFHI